MKKLVALILLFASCTWAAGPLSDPNVAALIREIAALTAASGNYQPTLVSGTNIKTLGGLSLLGSGDYGTLTAGYGGTGTSTTFTQGSVVYAGASGIYTQDANNFYYNPTGFSGSQPNFELGPRLSNPIDAGFEYYVSSGVTAHFHNVNTTQSATGGVTVGLMYVPTGAAVISGNRAGSLEFGGSYNTSDNVGTIAAVRSRPTENMASGHFGGQLEFCTVPNGSTTCTVALTIGQDQSGTWTGAVTGVSFNAITALASSPSPMDGTAAVGTSTTVARQDHVHPVDTSRAAVGQTMFIGTTSQAINRASAAEALTGITSIDGSAAKLTTAQTINGVSFDGSANIQTATANTSDYATNTWTPVFTNLTVVNGTGGASYSGTYTVIGNVVFWRAYITTTGTCTTASTLNTTHHTLPFTPAGNYINNSLNASTGISLGIGLADISGTSYPQTWVAQQGSITITGWFQK